MRTKETEGGKKERDQVEILHVGLSSPAAPSA